MDDAETIGKPQWDGIGAGFVWINTSRDYVVCQSTATCFRLFKHWDCFSLKRRRNEKKKRKRRKPNSDSTCWKRPPWRVIYGLESSWHFTCVREIKQWPSPCRKQPVIRFTLCGAVWCAAGAWTASWSMWEKKEKQGSVRSGLVHTSAKQFVASTFQYALLFELGNYYHSEPSSFRQQQIDRPFKALTPTAPFSLSAVIIKETFWGFS